MAKKQRGSDADSDDGSPEPGQSKEPADFESALAEVQKVVEKLETGELGLTESLAQYERGIQKVKQCHQALEKAERKIAVLTGVDEDGTATIEPVDTGIQSSRSPASADETGQSAPRKRVRKKSSPPSGNMDETEGLF